jgi:hypothetical protein
MSENEILVEQTENVETTTEEISTVKTYSQEEVDAIVGRAKARTKAKIEKDYQRKYGDLEEVLKAGTGKQSVEEITGAFTDYYRGKGVTIPEKPTYSAKDIEILARAEADEIIHSGFDEVVEEVDRLAGIGVANMTAKEKAVFKALAEHRQTAERGRELSSIGVAEDVYNSQSFREFSGKFNPNTPIKDIYDIYAKTQSKKDIKPMGSMKSGVQADNGVKEFYSVEEAKKIPVSEYNKNPALWEAVQRSMLKWK